MNGDIKLSAPGGLPGDIWLDNSDRSVSNFTLSGRVVSVTGTPRTGVAVTVFERRTLTLDVALVSTTTDARGYYRAPFALPGSKLLGDVFVRAQDSGTSDVADSALLNDVPAGAYTIDLVLGEGDYKGFTEWELVEDKLEPLLGSTLPHAIPVDRLEWLSKRADVFPLHLAAYIQAHRLSEGRGVLARTCYGFLRGGLSADMPGLLASGAAAWEAALRSAWTRAILPLPGDGTVEAQDAEVAVEMAAMRVLLVDAELVLPSEGVSRRVVLDTAGISLVDQRTFAELWADHEGTLEEFWTAVDGSTLAAQAPLLRFTFHAAAVTGNHVETIEALQAEAITQISETAEWSRADWDAMLDSNSVTPPEDISGADATEKRQRYARALFNIIEDGHRSLSLRHAIARDVPTGAPLHTDHIIAFLDANPDFDIAESNINVYLASELAVAPWTGIDPEDQDQARANLELVQRVYRLSPRIGRYETTKVLLNEGITSAASVVTRTREEFVEEFGPLFSDDDHHADGVAAAVWDNATEIVGSAMAVVSMYKWSSSPANWVPVSNFANDAFQGDTNGLDGLSQILGNLDFCACVHCRSVFSPAAYLADLLKFLEDRNLLDNLNARRPDIQHILLDCHNTNTILPYIDLVNELLEIYLNSNEEPEDPLALPNSSKQTTWEAGELRLHPEHIEAPVYDAELPALVYPWTLPFSLPTLEARVYLDRLGVPRQELLRACLPESPATSAEENAIAAEVLGLSETEFSIVAGTHSATNRECWGFSTDPSDDNWYQILRGDLDPELEFETDIGELLLRGKFTLDELRDLLALEFINPAGNVAFQWADTCALADASIAFMEVDNFDRLHRFVRLQRACRIPSRSLNVLIQDNLGGVLTEASLRILADIVTVKQRLRLDWDVVATFWSNKIDARYSETGPKSLYHRRFLGRDPIDLGDFELEPETTNLTGEGSGPISAEHMPRLLAGLGIRQDEYDVLRTVRPGHEVPPADPLEDPSFTFANITALFRWVALARATRLSIADLVLFAESEDPAAPPSLSNEAPFTSPSQTLAFLALVDDRRSGGFSLAELNWLLRHEFERDPLDVAVVTRSLTKLTRGLERTEAEAAQISTQPEVTQVEGGANGVLRVHLAKVVPTETLLDIAMEIVGRTSGLTEEQQDDFIANNFAAFLDVAEAQEILATPPPPLPAEAPLLSFDTNARTGWLLGKVIGHLRRKALVFDTVANEFGIDTDVAEVLLTEVLSTTPDPPDPSAPLFEAFRLPFVSEEELSTSDGFTPENHAPQFSGWTKLAKAAAICRAFAIRADEVSWYWGPDGDTWLDLDSLPLEEEGTDASYAMWHALTKALALRRLSLPDAIVLADVAETSTIEAATQVLADHTGWDVAGVLAAATHLGLTPLMIVQESAAFRLQTLAQMAQRIGVSIQDLLAWAITPTIAQASAIKLAARAKFGEERWPEIAAPLRDTIRDRQREALVDAVIAAEPVQFRTSNDVFEHFLIDVEMSHCMMTSRIKQAITSVQIFIHRVFLRLEDDASLVGEANKRWDWMKNYRVWEANRKVFLYPENWIEPELRIGKTPEFETLEADLIQGELTDDRVARAIEGFIGKIDRVSGLEIVSIETADPASVDAETWILGRTQAQPYEWFVRCRTRSGWGVWEEVPAAIEGHAVALKVIDGRLAIFWATSTPKEHWIRRHTAKAEAVWMLVDDATGEEDVIWSDGKDHMKVNEWSSTPDGAKIDGEVFRISHCDRNRDGTWGKVHTSASSSVAVKVGGKLRIQLWEHANDEIAIVLMSDWRVKSSYVQSVRLNEPSSRLILRAAFAYFPSERVVWFAGLEPTNGNSEVSVMTVYVSNDDHVLATKHVEDYGSFSIYHVSRAAIGRLSGYRFRGQRYQYSQDSLINVRVSVGENRAKRLLRTPSRGRGHAIVHQATTWKETANASLPPIVYDDWVRKYLVERARSEKGKNESTSPDVDAPLTITRYFGDCPEVTVMSKIFVQGSSSPPPPRQKLRARPPFRSGMPAGAQKVVGQQLDYGNAVLTEAATTATQGVGLEAPIGSVSAGPMEMRVEALYHPYARTALKALTVLGVDGLYGGSMLRQPLQHDAGEDLGAYVDIPLEEFDFSHTSAYGPYNWELFFHVPMLIAQKLAAEQRWDEAQRWFHFIFNPIDVVKGETGPERFWRTKPFVAEATGLLKNTFEAMAGIGVSEAERQKQVKAFATQVRAWEENPFDPHAIARVRPGVYQRAVLRKYFDNLIAWADNLFRRDTIESISEATVLYILVSQLLGPRPHEVPGPVAETVGKSYNDLSSSEDGLDAFANALVQVESWVYVPTKKVEKKGCQPSSGGPGWTRIPMVSRFWYFCYPPNPQLLEYWDTIADRLFKIRNCQNIEGQERSLALFEPPIDPALLVQAIAAGVDIQSVLAELDSALPPYRFRSVHARATGFVGSLKALGGALLSALEKRDSEELAQLRSTHELVTLSRIRDVRVMQVEEARRNIASLEAGKAVTAHRREHYQTLVSGKLNDKEKRQFQLASKAASARRFAGVHQQMAGMLGTIPTLTIGLTPGVAFGGVHIAAALNATAGVAHMVAAEYDYHGNKSGQKAGYERREEDWRLQLEQAAKELTRIDRDILGANIRLQIAERELDNHDRQVQQSREADMFMRNKFTNKQLYNWMAGQLSGVYFQTYQLAFDLAKRAERAYRHELAIEGGSPIIKYGYWDSLQRGLLAGEKLGHDLERLDLAYMDGDKREFELRKSVSLSSLNANALHDLQETGTCDFDLEEGLFDLDHPGHYLRRIRAIRLTIPAVVGPHTSLSARLRLKTHQTRFKNTPPYAEDPVDADHDRFKYGTGAGKSIATSSSVEDGGLFNLDFRDERYLPFEYAGVISSWTLDLPEAVRQFDYRTISDVIVHIDYTARDGGSQLRGAAEENLVTQLETATEGLELVQPIVVNDAFPNEWEQFFADPGGTDPQVLDLPISTSLFPYFAQRGTIQVIKYQVLLLLEDGVGADTDTLETTRTIGVTSTALVLTQDGGVMSGAVVSLTEAPSAWSLEVELADPPSTLQPDGRLDRTTIRGMVVLAHYTVSFA